MQQFNFEDRAEMVAQVQETFKIKPKLYTIEDSYKKTVKHHGNFSL